MHVEWPQPLVLWLNVTLGFSRLPLVVSKMSKMILSGCFGSFATPPGADVDVPVGLDLTAVLMKLGFIRAHDRLSVANRSATVPNWGAAHRLDLDAALEPDETRVLRARSILGAVSHVGREAQ
jgi:hypothetical protein